MLSPGRLLMTFAAGHTAWAAAAYGDELREIARAGVVDTVGDGLFSREEARGPRAAAFWFTAVGPILGLTGWLLERAERSGDAGAVRGAGAALTAIAVTGTAVIPRSGFPAGIPAGVYTYLCGRSYPRP